MLLSYNANLFFLMSMFTCWSLSFCKEKASFLLSANFCPPQPQTQAWCSEGEAANSHTAFTESRHCPSAVQKLITVTYSVLTTTL